MVAALFACVIFASGCDRALALAAGADLIDAPTLAGVRREAVVIDLRPQAEYEAGHIAGSLHLSATEINGALARTAVQRDRPLVFVDRTAAGAILAVPTARVHGFTMVAALAGGVEAWTRRGLQQEQGPSPSLPGDPSFEPPLQTLSRSQQIVAFSAGGVMKPIYMLLALAILIALRRLRSPGLGVLRHGMRWFLVGEAFCAVNYFYHHPGLVFPIELLHGAGMVAMSALIPWGLYRLFDERLFHFSDPGKRCTVQRLCGRCWKQEQVRCGPHDVMMVVAAGLAVLALLPWSAELRPTYLVTKIFGSSVDYGEPIVNHLVELRAYPAIGAVLLLVALLFLQGGPRSVARAEPLFFTGLGFTTYPLLRQLLLGLFRDALFWSDFWEELTELFMILAVGMVLIVFRRQLAGAQGEQRPQSAPAADA